MNIETPASAPVLKRKRRKRTPEQNAAWNESEAGKASAKRYVLKKREAAKAKARLSKPIGRKIRAMKADGWKDTTIAVVLKVSLSVIRDHLLNDEQLQPV